MDPARALSQWNLTQAIQSAPDEGLINHTWVVGDPPDAILQWVNPIFSPEIHQDIQQVTTHLARRGLVTPRLLPTPGGDLCVVDTDGCWRLQSYVIGSTVNAFSSNSQAASAAALVGRFHAALADLDMAFPHQRKHAHDTPAHMRNLQAALTLADAHPLGSRAMPVGKKILEAWQAWDGPLQLPERICHGDLKVSNIRMSTDSRRAVCLIDLDTLGHLPYSVELGDAWRSWCNPAPEDDFDNVRFDLEIFKATATAWLQEAPALSPLERDSLVPGIERICLELAARFCADALQNTYFREETDRYPERGAHNLARARTQLALATAALDRRGDCNAIVKSTGSLAPQAG